MSSFIVLRRMLSDGGRRQEFFSRSADRRQRSAGFFGPASNQSIPVGEDRNHDTICKTGFVLGSRRVARGL